jgi:hypothetical protein
MLSCRYSLQMFDLVKSSIATTYPLVIKQEYFVVQDPRPLYHWPESKLVPTKHDNWEPQFKPAPVVRPKSAVSVAPVAPVVPIVAPSKDEDEEDDEEGEEEDTLGEASLASLDKEQAETAAESGQEGAALPNATASGDGTELQQHAEYGEGEEGYEAQPYDENGYYDTNADAAGEGYGAYAGEEGGDIYEGQPDHQNEDNNADIVAEAQ